MLAQDAVDLTLRPVAPRRRGDRATVFDRPPCRADLGVGAAIRREELVPTDNGWVIGADACARAERDFLAARQLSAEAGHGDHDAGGWCGCLGSGHCVTS